MIFGDICHGDIKVSDQYGWNYKDFSENANLNQTQKGLRIGSICQFHIIPGIIGNYLHKASEMLYFPLIKKSSKVVC